MEPTRESPMRIFWFIGGTFAGMIVMSIALAQTFDSPIASDPSTAGEVTEMRVNREGPRDTETEMSKLAERERLFVERARRAPVHLRGRAQTKLSSSAYAPKKSVKPRSRRL